MGWWVGGVVGRGLSKGIRDDKACVLTSVEGISFWFPGILESVIFLKKGFNLKLNPI